MKEQLKLFIEANSNLLESGDFEELYARLDLQYRPHLTRMFLAADINPLPQMKNIPDGMYNRVDIANISTPSNIKSIGVLAFSRCLHLESAVFASGLVSIEDQAFHNCTRLKRIVLPDTLQVLRRYCFYSCPISSPLVFPSALTTIEVGAFRNCTTIEKITLPVSIKSIEMFAFLDTGLKEIIYQGTQEQFDKIELGKLCFGDNIISVTCTDGKFQLG